MIASRRQRPLTPLHPTANLMSLELNESGHSGPNRLVKVANKSDKFFKRFQQDVDASSLSFDARGLDSSYNLTGRVEEKKRMVPRSTALPLATKISNLQPKYQQDEFMPQRAHIRASGIPITKKTQLNSSLNAYTPSCFDTKSTRSEYLLQNSSMNLNELTSPPKAFTPQIYKKAIRTLNSKHRQLMQLQENAQLFRNESKSRPTSGGFEHSLMSNGSRLTEMIQSDNELMPVFSKSLADKIANARQRFDGHLVNSTDSFASSSTLLTSQPKSYLTRTNRLINAHSKKTLK